MKTIAIEIGSCHHIFAHQICSARFDNVLKRVEVRMSNKEEFVVASNANAEGYRGFIRQLVTAMNSPQPVIITAIDQPAVPKAEPNHDSENLCASCGAAPATTDGLCDGCMAKSLDEPDSFNGPAQ